MIIRQLEIEFNTLNKTNLNIRVSRFKVLKSALIASNELINKQPDIFNEKSLFLIIQVLNAKNLGDEFILLALQHLKHAALLHELNRQNIMNAGVLESLKPLIKTNNTEVSKLDGICYWISLHFVHLQVLKETCSLFRHLILDDDVRIEFSKAHEHARTIAAECLIELTHLLPIHMKDKNILSDLLLTIATLAVRHEFCVQVEEVGGVKFLNDCMVTILCRLTHTNLHRKKYNNKTIATLIQQQYRKSTHAPYVYLKSH